MQNKRLFTGILFSLLFGLASLTFGQSGEVYDQVDKEARFKGKPRNVSTFLQEYMKYPDEARLDLLEGTVEISAIVTDEGKLMEPEIEKGVDPLLDSEALRLVRLMQDWKPARKDGNEVNARVKIPVEFRLSEEEREFIQTLKKSGLDEKMPLFVIDDKIAKEYIVVPSYNVKSVRVIKGEKALERYGPEAKNGVVIFTTKRGTPPVR
jgi:TonB family protein